MEMERQRPTRGDPSWRKLRSDATSAGVETNHLHIDTGYIERDLNVALPLDRVRELVGEGVVGALADTHYSIMGFQGNDSSTLENESAPQIAGLPVPRMAASERSACTTPPPPARRRASQAA